MTLLHVDDPVLIPSRVVNFLLQLAKAKSYFVFKKSILRSHPAKSACQLFAYCSHTPIENTQRETHLRPLKQVVVVALPGAKYSLVDVFLFEISNRMEHRTELSSISLLVPSSDALCS